MTQSATDLRARARLVIQIYKTNNNRMKLIENKSKRHKNTNGLNFVYFKALQHLNAAQPSS